MKQGNKMGVLAKFLSKFGYENADHKLGQGVHNIPPRGRNSGRRIRKRTYKLPYKPASSYGFRGSPRTTKRCGSIPAPTLDQVRKLERRYATKLQVRHGLMFFSWGGDLFTKEEAQKRMEADMHQEIVKLPTIAELEAL